MKSFFLIIIILLSVSQLQSQPAKMEVIGTPILSESEIVARRTPDGRFCAGIQILSDLDGFSYDSYLGIVGAIVDDPGRDIIYIDPKERVLLVFHVGYEPLKIILTEIGVQLKEKQMWVIKIKGGVVKFLPVSFIVNPKDVQIFVDGYDMGSGPTIQLITGKHTIKIIKDQHYTKIDTINVNPNNVLFTYYLAQKPEMVFVKGGTYNMGDGISDETPKHEVFLNSFYIGKTEVTFDEYDLFCNATNRDMPSAQDWGRGTRPAINVNWYDAVEYCNWLSRQEGLIPCYTINRTLKDSNNTSEEDILKWIVSCNFTTNGYRLPTEAEWEYACRGGDKSKKYKYSGSNDASEVAWYRDNSDDKTHPVETKKPNELGIYDMSGNVSDWCWDWYSWYYYSLSPKNNPHGPVNGSNRVTRGGSKFFVVKLANCACRSKIEPNYRSDFLGFRLCRSYLK